MSFALFPISDQFEKIRSTNSFALFLLLGLSWQVGATIGTFLETALTRLKSVLCSGGGDVRRTSARTAQPDLGVPWAAGCGLRRCLACRARGQTGMERPVAARASATPVRSRPGCRLALAPRLPGRRTPGRRLAQRPRLAATDRPRPALAPGLAATGRPRLGPAHAPRLAPAHGARD